MIKNQTFVLKFFVLHKQNIIFTTFSANEPVTIMWTLQGGGEMGSMYVQS